MRCWKGTCVLVEQLRELACGVLKLEHLLDSGYDEHDGQGEAAGHVRESANMGAARQGGDRLGGYGAGGAHGLSLNYRTEENFRTRLGAPGTRRRRDLGRSYGDRSTKRKEQGEDGYT